MTQKQMQSLANDPMFAQIIAAAVAQGPKQATQVLTPLLAGAPAPPSKGRKATPAAAAPAATPQPKGKKGPREDTRTHVQVACNTSQGEPITVGYDETYGFGINVPGSKRMIFHHAAKWAALAEIAPAIPHIAAAIKAMTTEWGWPQE